MNLNNLRIDLAEHDLADLKCTKTQFQNWLNALRSSKYQQTQGCLHDDDGFCCLGIMADIELVQSGEFEWDRRNGKYLLHILGIKWFNDDSFLPADLMSGGLQAVLSEANDSGLTFPEIADALESHFMPLFQVEKQ